MEESSWIDSLRNEEELQRVKEEVNICLPARPPAGLYVRPFTCNNSIFTVQIFTNLIFEDLFSNICRGYSSSIKI